MSYLVEAAQRRDKERVPERVELDLRPWVEASDVVMDLALFAELGRRAVTAEVTRPDDSTSTTRFSVGKSGHYRARLPNATAGTYKASVSLGLVSEDGKKSRAQELPEVAWEIDGSRFGERPHRSSDLALLGDLARQTGEIVDPKSKEPKGPHAARD